jgi:Mn2+/Fe2+ NRAMP family transporter
LAARLRWGALERLITGCGPLFLRFVGPIAGNLTFWLFTAGIIGTGLLGVPVLAGAAAYGAGEALSWRVGLANKFHRARGFYVILALATLLGTLLNLTPIDPIKASTTRTVGWT